MLRKITIYRSPFPNLHPTVSPSTHVKKDKNSALQLNRQAVNPNFLEYGLVRKFKILSMLQQAGTLSTKEIHASCWPAGATLRACQMLMLMLYKAKLVRRVKYNYYLYQLDKRGIQLLNELHFLQQDKEESINLNTYTNMELNYFMNSIFPHATIS